MVWILTSAIQQYGLLTIGDGLCSQIPSLLISLATGILVTKGSKEADFSGVLIKQLFGIPKVLYIVGASMIFLGLVTPLNPVLFGAFGAAFLISGYSISKSIGEESIEEEVAAEESEAEEIRRPENVVSFCRWIRSNWNLAMESYRLRMSIRAGIFWIVSL